MEAEAKPVRSSTHAGGVLGRTLDIEGRLQRNPYGMVAGALGIGFVLGGGLFTRLAAKIVGAGLRVGLMAALPMLEKQIARAMSDTKPENPKENEQ